MLSAVIPSGLSYPALTLGRITGTPAVRPLDQPVIPGVPFVR